MSWDFFNSKTVVGRKEHRCSECDLTIPKGVSHTYCSGKVEGDFCDFRLCDVCDLITSEYNWSDFGDGEGFPMGYTRQYLMDEGIADPDAWAREHRDARLAKRKADAEKRGLETATRSVVYEVYAERRRQVDEEGRTADHDDLHRAGELALAASCYAFRSARPHPQPTVDWPWGVKWFKLGPVRRMLVKAAALIVAEIERLDRADQRRGA